MSLRARRELPTSRVSLRGMKPAAGQEVIETTLNHILDHLRQRGTVVQAKEFSQDELKTLQNQLQKLTDAYTVRVEQAGKDKEKEVMEV